MMIQEMLDEILEQVKALVYYSSTPEAAVSKVAKTARLSPAEVAEVQAAYLRLAEKYIELTDPRVLKGNQRIESWYTGPDFENAWCWPAYKKLLARKWTDRAIGRLDESSTKILAHMSHPANRFATRGLVVGYVQSGKTANYSALISKAADVGYRLFIVLAGTTSGLRRQTQRRLENDIVALNPGNWDKITGLERDFGYYPGVAESMLNPANRSVRILGVVKKNKTILEKLKTFLRNASAEVLASCPVLVIDDEADNASVNTKTDDRTTINRLIIEILGSLPKCAYVGYTATPFANVFIDPTSPQDLFPRDFIFDLPRPDDYFGAEKIFGRDLLWFDEEGSSFEGLDVVRRIDTDEHAMLQPRKASDRASFEPTVPDSLRAAVEYFLLATACRFARGQRDHSSMLVHTTQFVHLHARMKERLDEVLKDFRTNWKRRKDSLRKRWLAESEFSADFAKGITDYESVIEKLPEVLAMCEVVVDNGYSSSRLQYPENDPKVFIAIGGNTLSRGLTLEGLVVSYFIRTASAYDTLLQMGRWFGYRFGYEDLPRIWMTDELEEYFLFLAEVEEEIRRDIQRLEKQGKTPMDLAIRVRTHPKLQITAKQKMGSARLATASYSEQRLQSFLFKHDDDTWLQANLDAGRALVSEIMKTSRADRVGTNRLFRDAPVELVEKFLRSYRFHEDHDDLRQDLLLNYISRETQAGPEGALKSWNIGIIWREKPDAALGSVDLGIGELVPCISRSRFRWTSPCNIKALTSARDRLLDLRAPRASLDESAMIALRNEQAPRTGLLLLYPISKDSVPTYPALKGKLESRKCSECGVEHVMAPRGVAKRHPLLAAQHVLGVALVFPKSINSDASYMAANLSTLLAPDPEDLDVAAVQAELESEVAA